MEASSETIQCPGELVYLNNYNLKIAKFFFFLILPAVGPPQQVRPTVELQ